MGHSKPKIPREQKIAKDIMRRPKGVRFEPFQEGIETAIGRKEQQITAQFEELQAKRLESLRTAIMNAIGTLSYNPYQKKVEQSIAELRTRAIEPLEQTKQEAISSYKNVSGQIAPSLRFAGAYESTRIKQFKPIYKETQKFLTETKDFLKGIGLSDEEITKAIKPFTSIIEEGKRIGLRY
jgi:hypothetical protein